MTQAKKRVAQFRARRAAKGLKRLELWAHPEDHAALKLEAYRRWMLREKNKVARNR